MIKKFFTENIGTKLIALLLAFGLWFFVGMQNPELTMNYKDIPVAASQDGTGTNDEGLSVIGLKNQRVEVVARGKRSLLTSFKASDIRAWVDISDLTEPGTYNLPVHVTMPVSDLFIERITPVKVNVRVDFIETKEVPVALYTETEFEQGSHIIESSSFEPKTIKITGPATELAQVAEARVHVKVGEDGVSLSAVPFTLVNAAGEEVDRTYITANTDEVSVEVPVLAQKEVPLTVDLVNAPAGWDPSAISYTATPSKIVLIGERSVLDAIDEVNLGRIDLSTLGENPVYTFDIVLPDGVTTTLADLHATVSVTASDLESAIVTVSDIQVVNLPEGTEALVMTPSVDIKLRGKSEDLAAITAADISAVVDLQNKEIAYGTYELPLSVTLSPGNSGASVSGEYTVTVKLVKKQR